MGKQDTLPPPITIEIPNVLHSRKWANLNAPVEPVAFERVLVEGPWRRKRFAVIPEPVDVVGRRLTFDQIARGELPQLFERVGLGAVSFGLIKGREHFSEAAELLPLTHEHLPHITAETVLPVSRFRRSVASTVSSLDEDPGSRFILCRDQILAALARPSDLPINPHCDRFPWYVPVEPPKPVLTKDRWVTTDWGDPPQVPKAVRLDGPWRHLNVIAVSPSSPRFYSNRPLTYEILRGMNMDELQERFIHDGYLCRILDSRIDFVHLSALLEAHVQYVTPERTIDAKEFGRDPERIVNLMLQGQPHWYCFLRSGNTIFAEVTVPLPPSKRSASR
jgi:hypothetical protein